MHMDFAFFPLEDPVLSKSVDKTDFEKHKYYNMHNFFKKSYDDYLGPCSSMEHVIERMVDHFFVVLEYVAD